MGVESVVGWCWEEEKSVAKEGGGGRPEEVTAIQRKAEVPVCATSRAIFLTCLSKLLFWP